MKRYWVVILGRRFLTALMVIMVVNTIALASDDAAERGRAVAVELDRRDRGYGDNQADVTMTIVGRGGRQRTLQLTVEALENEPGGEKSLILFRSPRDIDGTALLTYANRDREDDQWLFLPAVSRVKRISSSNRAGAFMGSEFSYEDLIRQDVDKFSYKLIGTEDCDAGTCFVVERFPVDRSSGYSRQVLWVDAQHYRPMRIDYYDRAGARLKTLVYSDYQQYLEAYWRAGSMVMENHRNGHSTKLTWNAYRFRTGLSDADFAVSRLGRAR